jgi:hypothetical protein
MLLTVFMLKAGFPISFCGDQFLAMKMPELELYTIMSVESGDITLYRDTVEQLAHDIVKAEMPYILATVFKK